MQVKILGLCVGLASLMLVACQEEAGRGEAPLVAVPRACEAVSLEGLEAAPLLDTTPVYAHDSATLREALASPACQERACWLKLTGGLYQGPFVIPPGTLLEGVLHEGAPPRVRLDPERAGGSAGAALWVGSSQECRVTVLRNLDVYSDQIGILAVDASRVLLENLRVTSSSGIAVAFSGLEVLHLRKSSLRSTMTLEELRRVPTPARLKEWPAVGLLGESTALVVVDDTELAGFAGAGVALRDSKVRWNGGDIHDNQGYGMWLEGGLAEAHLEGLKVRGTLRSDLWGQQPAAAVVVTEGAHVESQGLRLEDNEGLGVFQHRATARHAGLRSVRSELPAYWFQDSGLGERPALELRDAVLEESRLAGLVGLSSQGATLESVQILRVLPVQSLQEFELVSFSDGVHLVGVLGALELRQIEIQDSFRVGMLIDGGGREGESSLELRQINIGLGDDAELGAQAYGLAVQSFPGEATLQEVVVQEELRQRDLQRQQPLDAISRRQLPLWGGERWVGQGGLLGGDGVLAEDALVGALGEEAP